MPVVDHFPTWTARAGAMVFTLLALSCNSPVKPPVCDPCPPVIVPSTPEELIQALSTAYQQRDYAAFENLFPNAADNAPYLFILSEPLPNGQTNWDLTEELRIHRRMFDPRNPLPGETPVPEVLWLDSISITLTQIGSFTERADLYSSPTNPDGLDATVWKAMDCQYQANLFFDTQSTTDYRVDGRADFVVIENLAKASGEDRKFLIYRWEDLGANLSENQILASTGDGLAASETTWSAIKSIYR